MTDQNHTQELNMLVYGDGWFRLDAKKLSAEEAVNEARRLLDCWNALEGIDDPAAFMRDVRLMIEAIDKGHTNTGVMFAMAVDKHLKGGEK